MELSHQLLKPSARRLKKLIAFSLPRPSTTSQSQVPLSIPSFYSLVLENWCVVCNFSVLAYKFLSWVEFNLGKFHKPNLHEVYQNDTPKFGGAIIFQDKKLKAF